MKKNIKYKVLIVILIIFTVFGVTQYRKIQHVMQGINGIYPLFGPKPVKILATEHYGNDILLSWSVPNDKLYDHIEIFYGDSLLTATRKNGKQIQIQGKNKSYILLARKHLDTNSYFSIYAVDQYGRYSKPKYSYINNNDRIDSLPDALFQYDYFDDEIKYAYYVLENNGMKAFFSRGVLIGIESKSDHGRIVDVNFNFLNSYLTPMDVFGGEGIVFSLYRDVYEDNLTWLEVVKSDNKITFTRRYLNDNRSEAIDYTLLDDKDLHIHFHSDFTERRYSLRINLLGDDDFKAATSWAAKNVSSIIQEPEHDNTDMEMIESQYENELSIDYKHQEDLFNDRYPYFGSRRFLKINPSTIFQIYHNGDKIFSIYGSKNEYFFYKNCSGEEDFTFGYKFPYSNGTHHIKEDLDIFLKIEY